MRSLVIYHFIYNARAHGIIVIYLRLEFYTSNFNVKVIAGEGKAALTGVEDTYAEHWPGYSLFSKM